MMKKQALIRRVDVFEAWSRWQDAINSDQSAFEKFIENPWLVHRASWDSYTYLDVAENTANKIDMLLGPHYRALIKAWYIKREPS